MVHIKRVELSHFKSFGGTTDVPLLTGFTVISGPNGSGKSNILDALLFCLGLASSKGMRAERLPDLVNHNQVNQRGTSEVSVTVTFDLSDWTWQDPTTLPETPPQPPRESLEALDSPSLAPDAESLEWSVTRRLRVTKGGNYSSNFFINGEPTTAGELHEYLRRLRIYPEGYNVVLQGDVTRIITMNARERREIIDELAGVAEFDRKIEQVKSTLDEVREREERYRIIEQELQRSLEKLASDKVKAEKYQKLKDQIHQKQGWEMVLIWRSLQTQVQQLEGTLKQGEQQLQKLDEQLQNLAGQIATKTAELQELNRQVKALGEDEQLSVNSKLASQKLKRSQLQQRYSELENIIREGEELIERKGQELIAYSQQFNQVNQEQEELERAITGYLTQERDEAKQLLANYRQQADSIAAASEIWVQEQSGITKQIQDIQNRLNPQKTEQARATERYNQLSQSIEKQRQQLIEIDQELGGQEQSLEGFNLAALEETIANLAQSLASLDQERTVVEQTRDRLLKEQREKNRQLDKLEATSQAQREAQGTHASQMILQENIQGVCGLVAQLGQVDTRYQLALETAAGARLGHIVVEHDGVAAQGIQLLKNKRAGRATFLPLNKINPPSFHEILALRQARGFVNYAIELVYCEPRYKKIFSYVFGNTVVFETLHDARQYLGQVRIVTLEGELLESSGAMTGGSQSSRHTLHFGTSLQGESREIEELHNRLVELDRIIAHCESNLQEIVEKSKEISQKLLDLRQQLREQQLRREQLEKERAKLSQQKAQISQQLGENEAEYETLTQHLRTLEETIPLQEEELRLEQQKLAELEASQTSSEWQGIQQLIKAQEQNLEGKEQNLRETQGRQLELRNQGSRLQEKIDQAQQMTQQKREEVSGSREQLQSLTLERHSLETEIQETETRLGELTAQLGAVKQERDRTEDTLQHLQTQQQQAQWQREKLQENQQQRQQDLIHLQEQEQTQRQDLPEPLPELPPDGQNLTPEQLPPYLENLQKDLRYAQKRLEGMEPVNMLALTEYEQTQTRLQELTDKLTTLEGERTELLLRIENFTTLRQRAFHEAFDAVNENFKTIFATLSEGDGYLELDNAENPFAGGLNLIAHPKGKPVQRLSSMSGGEKSLTALSFIFALQRYRPSPFYAFDEVDMFLDGANVERLAKMIKQQAQQAQFIVVSLRRPMIESAERTIGVTQARGAYTQVLGIKL
ncbi:chromosome segregation protein SMC [Spirulina subsalsa FACHB-351]|uniref:Chromosome partition protein Smc n=1 Tax=Spirulina subsalsa FACHB-351 TaxID=234711 RepID=A0ABT3KZZ9_9CYAN|nr:chromosome segregation protein SMC [Spirulina subsalsa]MCW6034817.1 chromosome segregation protein SMC [Spirulina subsalsa FACHB-351]